MEADWTKRVDGFYERPAAWLFSPYQLYLLLPAFIVVAFTFPISAWAGNNLLLALLEDVPYFDWRGRRVMKGEWTTRLFGSFRVASYEVRAWWAPSPCNRAGLLPSALLTT